MASAPDARTERLWFEAEPIHPAPRRPGPARRRLRDDPAAERQMELRIPPPRPARAAQTAAAAAQRPAPASPPPSPSPPPAPVAAPPPAPEPESPPSAAAVPFGAWLLDQANRRGTLGELAKAAKADRLFPRKGDADAVRARFSAAGADGDAFEALDDAERDYERQKQ